jgi:hypothetical protein
MIIVIVITGLKGHYSENRDCNNNRNSVITGCNDNRNRNYTITGLKGHYGENQDCNDNRNYTMTRQV